MDQYPDENEEYELRYQEELEMLDELDDNNEENYFSMAKPQPSKPVVSTPMPQQGVVLPSPQLSQIGCTQEDESGATSSRAYRRLFGTPKGPQRGASTPMGPKQRMPTLSEIIGFTEDEPNAEAAPLADAGQELQESGLRSKRRLEREPSPMRDLYGLDDDEFDDPLSKRMRSMEHVEEAAIEKILEKRRRLKALDTGDPIRDSLTRLGALHDYKMKNLSLTVPAWPFLTLCGANEDRIFVRFHSEDYEARAINEIRAVDNYDSLLGEKKQRVWSEASELVLKRTTLAPAGAAEGAAPVPVPPVQSSGHLWADKYKPRKYIDLLSDEMTNRSLLFWLKMWDRVVFGREFKIREDETAVASATGKLNSFNKRTGKFESNGGWRSRKTQQSLNMNVDDLGRPMQKVALLCGPPGLGKTTMAHTIARHVGYAVREINASDDRTPEAFRLALENGTQMSSVLDRDRRPNCIILDEIDGAPRQSIEYLCKFVSDSAGAKARGRPGKGAKASRTLLRRPIICICNDLYDPALRPLRQIAFVVTFPKIDSARLAERLLQIAYRERLKTDFGTLIALAEKSGNDVRSCIATMQFFSVQKLPLKLRDVLNASLGQKDRQQSLFEVWTAIFKIPRPKKQLEITTNPRDGGEAPMEEVTLSDMSAATRVQSVLTAVHAGGDYERLLQGVHENYLHQKMRDPDLNGVVEALQWFCFSDAVQRLINQQQNYTVYPYLQYGFAKWHLLFASLAFPKVNFPMRSFEHHQKTTTQRNIFQSLRKGIGAGAVGVGQGAVILLDTVPLLKHILAPNLRSVALQLLSQKEKDDLRHAVEVLLDMGIAFNQVKSAEGTYVFQMEPDLEQLAQFPMYPGMALSYFGRQLLAREVELERIRRSVPRLADGPPNEPAKPTKDAAPKMIPNHLRTLQPKRIDQNANSHAKETVSKDFFGRIQRKTVPAPGSEAAAKLDLIVKSPVWYRFKEGFNNAVRKDVHLRELL